MATINSTTYAAQITDPPTIVEAKSEFGRLRIIKFAFTADAAYNAGTVINLVKIGAGRVQVVGGSSLIIHSDFGATSDTLDVGFAAYTTDGGTAVAADPNGLHDGADVTSAGSFAPFSALADGTKVFDSDNGVILTATAPDADIPSGATIKGYFVVVVD